MLLQTLVVGALNTNCYLLSDPDTRDCVVIDPGANVHLILNALDEAQLSLRAILLTHAHFDHFGAMWPLYTRRPAPVYVNREDLAPFVNIGPQRFVPPPDTRFIGDGDRFTAGSLAFQVIACPGHTPGSVSYLCGDMLFSGDTLLHMACGRIDYPCSSPADMLATLAKLRELPGSYRLYPGHMESSALDYERQNNPYLQPGITFQEPEVDEDFCCTGPI